jgi:flagellar biosynthetic protein FliR
MSGEMLEVNRILVAFLVFVLVLIRCGCIVLFAPFFSSELFPAMFRLLFIAAFSLLLVPTAAETAEIPAVLDMLQLGLLAAQEFAIGMALGFLASLVFTGVQLAGEIAGQQIGFSMANVVDPMSNLEVPLLGFINMNLAMVLFLVANLHLVLIYIMMQSYQYLGIGALAPETAMDPVLRMSMEQARGLLLVGVELSVPIMLIMLMNSVVEGFITKTMPQMNIMVLGMPLRVALGVTALIFIYPVICIALVPPDWRFNLSDMPSGAFGDMLVDMSFMVREMGGR